MHSRFLERWNWLIFPVALSAAICLTALGRRGDLDGHEVLVAQTAREMLQTGDWIHPQFAGNSRFEKPPLAYWLAAGSFRLSGRIDEFSARLPTALSAIALVVAVGLWTARSFGRQAGLAAGIVQATGYWSIAYGKLALVEIPLTLLTTMAMFAGFEIVRRCKVSQKTILVFWFACAMTVLAKGPVAIGLIFPTLLTLLGLRWWLRSQVLQSGQRLETSSNQENFQRKVAKAQSCRESFVGENCTASSRPRVFALKALLSAHCAGLAAFLVLSLGWPVAVAVTRPEAIQVWTEQSFGRFAVHFGEQTRPWHFYLWMIPLLTLPWSPLWLVRGWQLLRRNRRASSAEKFLWTWFATGLIFFSLSAGKREHYILPALVPASVLAGLQLQRAVRRLAGTWHSKLGTQYGICRPRFFAYFIPFASAVVVFFVDGEVRRQRSTNPELRALIERNRDRLESADTVGQFGSNDRSTAFLVNRPMKWLRSDTDAPESSTSKTHLILVRRNGKSWPLGELGDVVDTTAFSRGSGKLNGKERWDLIAVKKQNRPDDEPPSGHVGAN